MPEPYPLARRHGAAAGNENGLALLVELVVVLANSGN
jgi:hypothetical protein